MTMAASNGSRATPSPSEESLLPWTRRDVLALAVMLLSATGAIWPLWRAGVRNDADMLMGVHRVYLLDRSFHQQAFWPRLALDNFCGYGGPLFQYYPPLASYVGLFFHWLGLGYIATSKATFALALLTARLGSDGVAFLGYDLAQPTFGPETPLELRLYWQSLQSLDTSYTVFVHLLGPDGQVWGQSDRKPMDGEALTTGWIPGEYIHDPYSLLLRPDAPAGEYRLEIGMSDPTNGVRLPVRCAGREDADHVILSEVECTGCSK